MYKTWRVLCGLGVLVVVHHSCVFDWFIGRIPPRFIHVFVISKVAQASASNEIHSLILRSTSIVQNAP